MSEEQKEHWRERLEKTGNDTVVQCKFCATIQYLLFKNGLKNGWCKCHNYTMPIVYTIANIERATKEAVEEMMETEKP